jgi:O-antigen ligase
MLDKLIYILPGITLLLFVLNIYFKGNSVQSCLLFVLTLLPLMDLKITNEAWGGFKVFDAICIYSVVFLLKDFTTINSSNPNNFYFLLFVLLAIIVLLGGLASEFPSRAYLNFFKILPIFIFARFFLTECYKDPYFYLRAIKGLKIAYLTALIFLLIQCVIGLRFTFYPKLNPNTVDPIFLITRYPGVFYDSQSSGQYLAMGSFLFLYVGKNALRKTYIFNYLVFVTAIIGINLAGSRSAFGGFAVGLIVVFFMAAKQYRVYGLIAALAGYLIFTFVSVQTGVFDRTKNLSDDFLFRQSIWKEAFEISKKHPWLGIGSGNYQNYVIRHAQGQYLEMSEGQLVYFDQPENGYLKIMSELGFIGFGIFVLYLLVPLVKGFVFYIKGIFGKEIAFFMAALISWAVAFNTVYSIYDYRILIMVVSMIILIICYPVNEDDAQFIPDKEV